VEFKIQEKGSKIHQKVITIFLPLILLENSGVEKENTHLK